MKSLREPFPSGPWGPALIAASFLRCGGSADVTTLTGGSEGNETSRTLAVLAEPGAIDAACRLIGVSSRNVAGTAGSVATCTRIVEQCHTTTTEVLAAQAAGAEGLEGAAGLGLQALLGCPVTGIELDACVAQILERGRDTYAGQVSCETTALPDIDPAFLLAAPACLGVVLRCPELLSLGELFLGGAR